MPNWTTEDYFNPFPGMTVYDRRQQMAESKRATGAQEKRLEEDQRMRQADAMARMGVQPVMGADGVDWGATAQAATLKQELGKQAQALATMHAWSGMPAQMTPEEQALTKLPEYQTAYHMVSGIKAQKDAANDAIMEQIGARAKAAAEARANPMATITEDLPGGGKVRIPVSAEEAQRMRQTSTAPGEVDQYQDAIEAIIRFKESGVPIDVDIDSQGYPKVTKSKFWHDAKPSDPKSYQRQIDKIMKSRGGAAAPAASSSGKPVIVIKR